MGKSRCTGMLMLTLFLAMMANFSTCSLGFQTQENLSATDYLINRAGDMTIRFLPMAGTAQVPDLGDFLLPDGRSYQYLVVTGITSVFTRFQLSNSTGNFDKELLTWSDDPNSGLPCITLCQWWIDSTGFSVVNPVTFANVLVTGWDGPA